MNIIFNPTFKSFLNHKKLILILFISFIINLILLLEGKNDPTFLTPIIDEATYINNASEIITQSKIPGSVFYQPPFIVFFIYLIFFFFPKSIIAVKCFLLILSLCSILLIFLITKIIFNKNIALLSTIITTLYGPIIFFNTRILPSSIAIFFNLLFIYLFLQKKLPLAKRSFLSGLVLGLSVITIPNSLMFTPVVFGYLLAQKISNEFFKSVVMPFLLFLIGMIIIILPITRHNYIYSKRIIPVSANGGINLYLGNNKNANETTSIRPDMGWVQLQILLQKNNIHSISEADSFFIQKTITYIKTHFFHFLKGIVLKSFQFINARELPRNLDIYLYRKYYTVLKLLIWKLGFFYFPWGILFPFSCLGVLSLIKSRCIDGYFLLSLSCIYSLSIILFFISARYRVVITPIFIIFSASGFASFYKSIKTPKLFIKKIFFLIFFLLCVNYPIKTPFDHINFEAEQHTLLGVKSFYQNDFTEAKKQYEKAKNIDPYSPELYFNLGELYYLQNNIPAAKKSFLKVIKLDPMFVWVYEHLAIIAENEENFTEAINYLIKGIKINNNISSFYKNLSRIYIKTENRNKAKQILEKSLQINNQDPETYYYYALVLDQLDQFEAAIKNYTKGIKIDAKESVYCFLGLAQTISNKGKIKEAIAILQEAIKKYPNNNMVKKELNKLQSQNN